MAKKTGRREPGAVRLRQELKYPWLVPVMGLLYFVVTCMMLHGQNKVITLLLMVAALKFGVLKLDQVRETGLFLTGIFPLLFVPAAAGVMELGSQLLNLLLPAVLAIVPITALVMAVTGMVAQKCAGGKEHKNG